MHFHAFSLKFLQSLPVHLFQTQIQLPSNIDGVTTVKFVFETVAGVKFDANLMDNLTEEMHFNISFYLALVLFEQSNCID